jgi:hypothetical protein
MSLLNSDKLIQNLQTGATNKALGSIPGMSGKLKANFDSNGFKSLSGNFNNILKKRPRAGRGASPLRDLYKKNGGKVYQPIIFPADLDNEHYMIFNVMDRKRPSKNDVLKKRALRSIVLPIPSTLTNQHGVSYNNENLQALGSLATGKTSLDNIAQGASDVGNLIANKVGNVHKMIMGTDANISADEKKRLEGQSAGSAATGLATAAIASGGTLATLVGLGGLGGASQILSGVGQSEGIALNPHSAILFDNVNFREFGFSYKFIARNGKESETINDLIDVFKYYMHPSTNWAGGAFFEYPEEFDIEFSEKLAPYLFAIRRCVLRSMSVNYNGVNTPVFFEQTGAPVSIEIQLTFQETELLTKEKVTNPNFKDWNIEH